MTHAHRFLYLGDLTTPDGAGRPVYWCGDCGTAVERFASQVAEIVPEWSRERSAGVELRRQDFSHVEPAWMPTSGIGARRGSRLGRGLADVQREHDQQPGRGLVFLLRGQR